MLGYYLLIHTNFPDVIRQANDTRMIDFLSLLFLWSELSFTDRLWTRGGRFHSEH